MSEPRPASVGGGPPRPIRPSVLLAGVLSIVAAAYSPAMGASFAWDDWPLIVEQPLVHDIQPGRYFAEPFWARSPTESQARPYYRPLVTLSYAVDWRLGGGSPFVFHLVNLLAHLVVVSLVFALALTGGAQPIVAAFAACLFGVFPRLTESVAWISGRTDVFAALFSLAAILAYQRSGTAPYRRVMAGLLVTLGLLCKEVAIAGVFGIAAWELSRWARRETSTRDAFFDFLPVATGTGIYLGARALIPRTLEYDSSSGPAPLATRLVTAVEACGRYATMLLDPLRPRLQIGQVAQPEGPFVLAGVVVVGALVIALVLTARRRWLPRPPVLTGIVVFLVGIGLTLHIVPIAVNVVAADRFLYLPLAGMSVSIAVTLDGLRGMRSRAALAVAALAVMAFASATYVSAALWVDEVVLWREALVTTPPGNRIPANELASALYRAGRHDEAIQYLQRAVARTSASRRPAVLSNLAVNLSEVGRIAEARAAMTEVLLIESELPVNHYNLGIIEARDLRFAAARRELGAALSLAPNYGKAMKALAMVSEVEAEWIRLPPERPEEHRDIAVRRAALWTRLGNGPRAASTWARVLSAPDAGLEDIRVGALVVVRWGTREEVQATLASAERLGAPHEARAALELVAARRFPGSAH